MEGTVIVVDPGTHKIKIGIVGGPSHRPNNLQLVPSDRLSIEQGFITQWDHFSKLLDTCYHQSLRCTPENHPVFFAESVMNLPTNRRQLAVLNFELFNVPAFYSMFAPCLSAMAFGLTTALSIDCGESLTACAVYDSAIVKHSVVKNNISGSQITAYLAQLMHQQRNHRLPSTLREFAVVEGMKEYRGEIAMSPELLEWSPTATDNQRYRAPEVLFKPSLLPLSLSECHVVPFDANWISQLRLQLEHPEGLWELIPQDLIRTMYNYEPDWILNGTGLGLHQMVKKSIEQSPFYMREKLFGNVLLSGGSSLFPNIGERLKKELDELECPFPVAVGKHDPLRGNSVWIGGSKWVQSSFMENCWITREEYSEIGESVVLAKLP